MFFITILNKKNKLIIFILSLFLILILSFIFYFIYLNQNEISEGFLEQPKTFNPILARNDPEKAISEILFRSLIKLDGKGNLVYDLAKNIYFNSTTKEYLINIENSFWSDGNPITSDDIIFTFKIIKLDPENPLYSIFKDIDIEKLDSNTIKIKIKEDGDWKEKNFIYQYFTFKIIPQHIWSKINYQNWLLSKENFEPITSGFYKIKKVSKNIDGSFNYIIFEKSKNIPGFKKIKFVFFQNENEIKDAFLTKKINFFLTENPFFDDSIKFKYKIKIPRYFALWIENEKIRNYFKSIDFSFLKKDFGNVQFPLNIEFPQNIKFSLNLEKDQKIEKAPTSTIKIFFPDNKIIEKILLKIKENLKDQIKIELVKLDNKTFQEKILNDPEFLKNNVVLFGEKYYILPYFPFLSYKLPEKDFKNFIKLNEKIKREGKIDEDFLKELKKLPIVFLFSIDSIYLSKKNLKLNEIYLNDESQRYNILPYIKN